jgi:hypothetical protein
MDGTPVDFVTLPESLIAAALASVVSRAMQHVLDAEPPERMGMMLLAIPVLQEAEEAKKIFSVKCAIDRDVAARFETYCDDMNLKAMVLLTGAMMAELKLGDLQNQLPDFSDLHDPDSE